MILALKHPDGGYLLLDDPSGSSEGKTYNRKEEIKKAGGKWNGEHWFIPSLDKISFAEKLYEVRVKPFCHLKEHISCATETEVKKKSSLVSCWGCEGKSNRGYAEIIEVIGEFCIMKPDVLPETKKKKEDDFLEDNKSSDLW
jgi:hypothetical protein